MSEQTYSDDGVCLHALLQHLKLIAARSVSLGGSFMFVHVLRDDVWCEQETQDIRRNVESLGENLSLP